MNSYIGQFSPTQPLPLLNQLGISQDEIDRNVRNRIEQEKANTSSLDKFRENITTVMKDNDIDFDTAYSETLKYYKRNGYNIEGIDIDEEISKLEAETMQNQNRITQEEINKKASEIEKEYGMIELGNKGVLGTISDFFKFGQGYLESEGKQGLISETMGGISQSVEETRQIEAGAEIGIKEGILNTAEGLMGISGSLGISDGEWKKALKEFNIESSEKMAKAMDVDAEGTYENIGNALGKFGLALAPIPGTSKIEITNKAGKVLWTGTKWALEGLKGEAIFEGEMTTEGIAYGIGIPVAFKALGGAFKGVKALGPGIKKFLAKKYPGLPTRLIDDIDNNPELINKLLKGEIKSGDLYKELTKRFPDENITMDSIKKLRQDFAALYDDIIAKGKVSEDGILDMATQRLDELKELRKTEGATVGTFRTGDLIKNPQGLKQTIDATIKKMGVKGVNSIDDLDDWGREVDDILAGTTSKKVDKLAGLSDDERKVVNTIYKEYKNIISDPKNITKEELIKFHRTINKYAELDKAQATDIFKQKMRMFGDDLNDYVNTSVGKEYELAKQSFKETMDQFNDFRAEIMNKATGTVKENLRSQIQSLKNPNNKEKLKSLSKAFGEENEQKFLQYLDDVFKGGEAEKVVQKVTKAEEVTNLLKGIRSGKQGLGFSTRDKEFLLKRLEEIKSQQFKSNIIKKLPVDDQGNLRIGDISDSLIDNIAKADTKLADDIRIAKSISNLGRDVGLSGGMSPISFDFWASMLFRDAKSVTQGLVNYELAKKGTAGLSTKIIEGLRKGTGLSSDEATLLKEYLVKVSVMGNIENDIYEGIPETLISK